ncbi:ULK3 [Acanthosepion pharaonis]|uniref:non-specific serine/threonine protein kinase n=1 Tax=Acanthosepion pharaonis TaxID=158019 RepID=A0A812B938_ACAPH|nr:ULK3 [Sepia pharaonis]
MLKFHILSFFMSIYYYSIYSMTELQECLFGQAPFASKSFQELEEKIIDSKPIELPYGVEVSDKCRDILLQLLKRVPDERIQFTEFFFHPFIDLEHAPSSTSLEKAKRIVNEAVHEDEIGNIHTAVRLYSDALEHFVAAIRYERHSIKKEALRAKVQSYFNRAEELKQMIKPKASLARSFSVNSNSCLSNNSSTTKTQNELMVLANNEEELLKALKEIKIAETEIIEEKYKSALKHYEDALEVCLQLIQTEPSGRRKELLCAEVKKSMSQAEQIKRYLSVHSDLGTDEITLQEKKAHDSIDQCLLQ